jgi:shikimate dehydrogenase
MGVEPRFEVLDPGAPAVVERVVTADVVVSTLPSHAADPLADSLGGRLADGTDGARPVGVLLDVVYDPRPTAFSAAWAQGGGTVVGGQRMLLHQAAEQVRLMTGRPAPLAAMDAALEQALGARTAQPSV